jgi:signal transduction histidine kinase
VLQAGAAEQVVESAPQRAGAAARAVEAQGRGALGELHELLGVLRGDEEPSPRAPQPSLAQLDALVEQVSRTGLRVELRITGKRPPLPVGVEVSAYRIIQEALTNSLKHACPARATVTLDFAPDALMLVVLDDGGDTATRPVEGAGQGMIGMRERVALYRGEFFAGARPLSGYEVRARLPLHSAAP